MHDFTIEVVLPELINTQKHTKTAYSRRLFIKCKNRKSSKICKEYFTNF